MRNAAVRRPLPLIPTALAGANLPLTAAFVYDSVSPMAVCENPGTFNAAGNRNAEGTIDNLAVGGEQRTDRTDLLGAFLTAVHAKSDRGTGPVSRRRSSRLRGGGGMSVARE
jgi:hypothetical protein